MRYGYSNDPWLEIVHRAELRSNSGDITNTKNQNKKKGRDDRHSKLRTRPEENAPDSVNILRVAIRCTTIKESAQLYELHVKTLRVMRRKMANEKMTSDVDVKLLLTNFVGCHGNNVEIREVLSATLS